MLIEIYKLMWTGFYSSFLNQAPRLVILRKGSGGLVQHSGNLICTHVTCNTRGGSWYSETLRRNDRVGGPV
ncbi:hypothetical protein EB796_021996 [Bugula neritina]|uniref:Uncharacterized protein n=1 Tax=Bugula neritina TaxID=10212 RepID=A0A7J7J2U5_BUGNE|nr:hypothetical protein EB796_021996 [Bugula neritina]